MNSNPYQSPEDAPVTADEPAADNGKTRSISLYYLAMFVGSLIVLIASVGLMILTILAGRPPHAITPFAIAASYFTFYSWKRLRW